MRHYRCSACEESFSAEPARIVSMPYAGFCVFCGAPSSVLDQPARDPDEVVRTGKKLSIAMRQRRAPHA